MKSTNLSIFVLFLSAIGCQTGLNPIQPASESQVLTDLVQLTHGFQRAGEAYFSPDMQWIIFQAAMKEDEDYLMYVAKVKWAPAGMAHTSKPGTEPYAGRFEPAIIGTEPLIRISPIPSWNSCGNFSPGGESLIFASTALNPKPREQTSGYQRSSSSYRWNMPTTAQIFRADNWKGAVGAAKSGFANLAQHSLTTNEGYHAECAYSPDGKWIVYAAQVEGDMELFVMRLDGSRQTRLTYVKGYDGGPFFSPEGRRLVYRSDRKGNDLLQIFTADLVFDRDGNITGIANEKQLTTEEENNRIAAKLAEESAVGSGQSAVDQRSEKREAGSEKSEDRSQKSEARQTRMSAPPEQSAIGNPQSAMGSGAMPTPAPGTAASQSGAVAGAGMPNAASTSQPAQSPNAATRSTASELLRSNSPHAATDPSNYRVVSWTPYWHPDGQHIVYATSLHGHRNYEIYMMRADGSHKTRITNSPTFDGLPVFSPDGKWLMWTSKRGGNTSQIWVARFKIPQGS